MQEFYKSKRTTGLGRARKFLFLAGGEGGRSESEISSSTPLPGAILTSGEPAQETRGFGLIEGTLELSPAEMGAEIKGFRSF